MANSLNEVNSKFKVHKSVKSVSTNVTAIDDDHPVIKFKRISNELDLIEKDLKFYSEKVRNFL